MCSTPKGHRVCMNCLCEVCVYAMSGMFVGVVFLSSPFFVLFSQGFLNIPDFVGLVYEALWYIVHKTTEKQAANIPRVRT